MKYIKKAIFLELCLMKDYVRLFLIFFILGTVMGIVYSSPSLAVSYVMATIAILGSNPFLIEEKNGMERLYSMIPVPAKARVISRYLTFLVSGFIIFIIAIGAQIMVYDFRYQTINGGEYFLTAISSLFILVFFLSIQFPCYYKWGPTKGRLASLVPAAFIILIPITVSLFPAPVNILVTLFDKALENFIIATAILIILTVIMLVSSMAISLKISKNKEY